jgi:hypothetical protein
MNALVILTAMHEEKTNNDDDDNTQRNRNACLTYDVFDS